MLNLKLYCCQDTKEFDDRKLSAQMLSSSYYVHPCNTNQVAKGTDQKKL